MAKLHHHLRNAVIPHEGNDYQPHALRRNALHIYTLIIVTVKIAAVFFVSVFAFQAQLSDVTARTIINLTNKARQQNKVTIVNSNLKLMNAAQYKLNDMTQNHYFAHVSPLGMTPWVWFKKAGYKYTLAGENLAIDFAQSEDILAAWLKSPSHRKNLLNGKFRDIGVAVGTAKIAGLDSLLVVQMFGTPTATAPVKPTTTAKPTTTTTTPPKTVLGTTNPEPVTNTNTSPTPTPTTTPPVVITPTPGAIVSGQPSVSGTTYPNATVELFINDQVVATTTADELGAYTLKPTNVLPTGTATLHVTATIRNQTAVSSLVQGLTVDATPPTIDPLQSFVIPSYQAERAYDISVTVNGEPVSVVAQVAGREVPLTLNGGRYVATVTSPSGTIGGAVTIVAVDGTGNRSTITLADPEPFTSGVIAPTSSPIISALNVIFFSRAFLTLMVVMLLGLATMNIVIQWRHQHHPTIVGSLLVVYLAGTLLFI